MILNYQPNVNFYITPQEIGPLASQKQGIMIAWEGLATTTYKGIAPTMTFDTDTGVPLDPMTQSAFITQTVEITRATVKFENQSVYPKFIRIEKADSIAGPFTELITVMHSALRYLDENATLDSWYRLVMIDWNGSELAPSLPKNIWYPTTCRLFGRCILPTGQPVPEAVIYFQVLRLPANNTVPGFMLSERAAEVTTIKDGYFEIDLVVGIAVAVTCSALGMHKIEFLVPNNMSANIWELVNI